MAPLSRRLKQDHIVLPFSLCHVNGVSYLEVAFSAGSQNEEEMGAELVLKVHMHETEINLSCKPPI